MSRGYIREEIPTAIVQCLQHRYRGLANAHTRQYGLENIDGLLLSVYMQGVRDAAEVLDKYDGEKEK